MPKRLTACLVGILFAGAFALPARPAAVSDQSNKPDEVRKVIMASVDAMKRLTTYEFSFLSRGAGAFEKTTPWFEGKARVTLGPPSGPLKFLIEGVLRDQASSPSSRQNLVVTSDGRMTSVLEESTRTLWRGDKLRGGGILFSRKTDMFLPVLVDPQSLASVLEYEGMIKSPETVDGTVCDVVFFPLPAGGGYTYRFGQRDHFPRSISWTGSKDGAPGSKTIEINGFKSIVPPAASAFSAQLPAGYQVRQFTPGGPAVGDMAPAWTVTDDRNNTLSLASLKGQAVVMDFWATWCGPCRASIPKLNSLSQEFRNRPIKFIGLTWMDKGDSRAYFQKNGVAYPTFPGDSLAEAYGINSSGIPAVFVIGPDGRVFDFLIGYYREETDQALRQAVEKALAETPGRR